MSKLHEDWASMTSDEEEEETTKMDVDDDVDEEEEEQTATRDDDRYDEEPYDEQQQQQAQSEQRAQWADSSSNSAAADSRYTLAAVEADTEAQVDPTAPPCSAGGFRPLQSLDPLPIDRLLPTIQRRVDSEPLTIVQAATGSGKSSRIPATLVREWYAPATVAARDEKRRVWAAKLQQSGADPHSEANYPPAIRRHPLILCTQPRRIAAISLAKRVASELGEEVGCTVGFKIGHESMADKRTKLLFVTSGWLLQKLVHNPSYLGECSHLVLDEIHERGLDADILYVILKRILRALVKFDRDQGRPADLPSYPSLVMMSATFSTDLFGAYFCSVYKDIPAFRHYARSSALRPICIETRRYPVSVFHLEDILSAPMLRGNAPMLNRLLADNPASTLHGLVAKMSRPPPPSGGMGGGSAQTASSAALGPISNSLLHVISWLCSALALCHRSDPEDGNCVLVFFPGLAEIEAAAQMIDEDLLKRTYQKTVRTTIDAEGRPQEEEVFDDEDPETNGGGQWRRGGAPSLASDTEVRTVPMSDLVELMILHSVVDDQLKVFEPVAPGRTRVILATNIAESSVTIPYVKYVIDLGAHKEVEYNDKFQCEMLVRGQKHTRQVKKWVSQASAKQRAGRCGRLSPGTVLRLYPAVVYNRIMAPYDLPELLRVSLASTILRLKMTASGADEDGHIHAIKEGAEGRAAGASSVPAKAVALGPARFDPSVCNLNDPHSVLSECMQPPDLSAIDAAYEELIKNGAVDLGAQGAGRDISRFGTSAPGATQAQAQRNARGDSMGGSLSVEERRRVYQQSQPTPLGRFFAALPFSFHLSRLVALGVVCGPRFLAHAVIISASLSMGDVYLMPMQARGSAGGGGGGGGSRRDEPDPYPQYVARTTRTRMWCDAGINSDAIGMIRLVDAYLKFRQHLSDTSTQQGSGGISRRSHLLNDWCAERGVHMKRIKTLTSTISEICYRISGLVHQEEERDALLQLAAMCGKARARPPPPSNARGGQGGAGNSRFPARGGASDAAPARRHYTHSTPGSAVADRDSDRGNSAHDDLFHLLQSVRPASAAVAYDFHSDLLSTTAAPADLLSLDPESVAVLQFMLASALLPNLLMGSAAPATLGEGLPYGPHGQSRLDPANTMVVGRVPAPLLSGSAVKLQHRDDFREVSHAFTHVLISNDATPAGRKGKNQRDDGAAPAGSMALEFAPTPSERYQRMRVALDGRPASHLSAADKALVPVLAFPTLEMLTLHRMFANGKYNIVDRPSSSMAGGYGGSQFQSQAYSQQQQQGTSMYVLADAKLPGKAIKWRLFSPRSPARLDFLSPISAITAYTVSARSLKETGGFSDYEAGGATDSPQVVASAPAGGAAAAAAAADKGGKGGKKGKKGAKPGSKGGKLSKQQEREEQMAAMKAAALAQQSKPTDERQIFAVAASMTVSSGAQAEIRAEKVTLLPVGANSGVTSVILSLLLPGDLAVGAAGITGVKFEGATVHFTGVLDAQLKAPLLAMRALVSGLLSQEFVRVLPDSRKLTPLFLQLVRPLIKSKAAAYPSTDPPGFVRRKLNLLPPSNPRPTGMQERAGMGAAVGGVAAASVDQAVQRFEQQRAQVLERAKARREAVAAAAATATATAPRPSSAAAPAPTAASASAGAAPTPAATLAAVQAQFANERAELLERMRTRKQSKPQAGSAQAPAPAASSGSASARAPAPVNNGSAAAPAPAPVASPASSPSSSSSSSSSPDLLSMLTRVWSSAPATLTMNQLCVLFNNLHRTTWKAASGNKVSMKEFIQKHPALFKIAGQANEPTITFLQHSGAASAEVKSPQAAQQNGQKQPQQPKQQQQQKPKQQQQQQQQKQPKQPKQQGKQQQQQQASKPAAAPQAKQ